MGVSEREKTGTQYEGNGVRNPKKIKKKGFLEKVYEKRNRNSVWEIYLKIEDDME